MNKNNTLLTIIIVFLTNIAFGANFADTLTELAEKGWVEKGKSLIDATDDVNVLGEHGQPAIMMLFHLVGRDEDESNIKARDELINHLMNKKGFNPNVKSKDNETVLIELIRSFDAGHKHMYLTKLLQLKANPNEPGRYWRPLYQAVIKKDLKAVRILLDGGASPDLGSNNMTTPAHLAVKDKNYQVADLLVTRGANLKLKNQKGESAIEVLDNDVGRLLPNKSDKKETLLELLMQHLPKAVAQIVLEYMKPAKVYVSSGSAATCVIFGNGELGCWGQSGSGHATVPDEFKQDVTKVAVGGLHTCAVKTSGQLGCWGENSSKQSTVPDEFKQDVAQVSAGGLHTCAVKTSGQLGCWGENSSRQSTMPDEFKQDVTKVAAGGSHTCAVKNNGQLGCWGMDFFGQSTVADGFKQDVAQVSAGRNHTCAVKNNGQLSCWGNDQNKQSTVPDEFKQNVAQVSAGGSHTCAVKNNGQLGCWGSNYSGESTVPVAFKQNVAQVSAGVQHTCAVKNNGNIGCWGNDEYGELLWPRIKNGLSTIINFAIHSEDLRTKDLVINQQDPNKGDSPLITAVFKQELEFVQKLLENGADAFLRRKDGATAIDFALGGKNHAIKSLITNHIDANGESLLKRAKRLGRADLVKKLLELGAQDQ